MAYASRNLPPMNVGASSSNSFGFNSDPRNSTQYHASRALPRSFFEPPQPIEPLEYHDKRSTQRFEQPISNPNQIRKVDGRYFPSVPRAAVRPREFTEEFDDGREDSEWRRSSGLPFGEGNESFGNESFEQNNVGEGDRMDVDREDENSRKRSRTLTTAHQTAVLTNLLAKTRFPSTETREEVGQQIGMSARRVQIWFQNRRQSQKRARDRESTDMGSPQPFQTLQLDNGPALPSKDDRSRNLFSLPPLELYPNHSNHQQPASQHESFRIRQTSTSASFPSHHLYDRNATETLMTLPESPQSSHSYRTNYSNSTGSTIRKTDTSHHHQFIPSNSSTHSASTEKFVFPRIRNGSAGSESSGSVFSDNSSRGTKESLLNNSMHSRSSSSTSMWSDFSQALPTKNDSRNLLPPISNLMMDFGEWNKRGSTQKGLPLAPSNYGSRPPPPPAPSTGSRGNSYNQHPFIPQQNRKSTGSIDSHRVPLDSSAAPRLSFDPSATNRATGARERGESLPRLDDLQISNSVRNSIISNRSSTYSTNAPSSRNSFYSFQSDSEKVDSGLSDDGLDLAMNLMSQERGGRAPIHLAPMLGGNNGALPSLFRFSGKSNRLPSLSLATGNETGEEVAAPGGWR